MSLSKLQKIAFASLLLVSIGGGAAASVAWFDMRTKLTPQRNFEGISEGAYFAYGNGKPRQDGTQDEPYGIQTPRQLYNLAWLQYLGLIDDVFNQNPKTSEAYFELANDIDMTGWTLPPIGTTTNPFMGHFNGNGYSITNLTVSNLESDFNSGSSKKPERASNFSSDIPHIVGLFGVVGPYYGSNLSYSSATDAITNLDVSGITIKSQVNDGTLAGLVAGYVNGPISQVAITDADSTHKSTLDLHAANGTSATAPYSSGKNAAGTSFSKISEFGAAGYVESAYLSQATRKLSNHYGYSRDLDDNFTAASQGEEAGFGGSIDMKTMYNGIRSVWDSYSNSADGIPEYPTKRNVVYDANGQIISDDYSDYTDVSTISAGNWNYQYFQAEQKDGTKVTSSYSFARRTDSNYYMYLYGDKTNTVSNAITRTNLTEKNGTVITISKQVNSTTYYLRYNNGLTYTTNSGQATQWVFKDGKIFYADNSGSSTTIRYLYKNGTSLAATTTSGSASTFNYDSTNLSYYVTQSNTNYYLSYNQSSSSWVFVNDYTATVIHSGSHYLTASSWANNQAIADTTLAYAPSWSLPANGSSGRISTTQNGTTYYLQQNNTTNLRIVTNANNATSFNVSSDGDVISVNGYSIGYKNGWGLFNTSGYHIYDGSGHYLSTDGSTLTSTNQENATLWQLNGNYPYYLANGNTYYLSGTTSSPYYQVSTSTSNRFYRDTQNNKTYLYTTTSTGALFWTTTYHHYIRYNNGWVVSRDSTQNTARNNGTPLTIELVNVPVNVTIERDLPISCDKNTVSTTVGSTYYDNKSTATEDATYTTKPTYFPLRQEKTGSTPNGIPQATNTGYVISGGNSDTGDIRVSQYVSNSTHGGPFISNYGSNGIKKVYSRDDDGDFWIYNTSTGVDLSANYEKFSDTRTKLESVFTSDTSNVYGLHFVGATVRYSGGTGVYAGNSVYAEKAIINRETHYDYELPKDAIDFNLKEKGYVNFMAGTYFSGADDCFFSLHDLGRNGDQSINYIKEIIEIYEPKNPTHSYVYKYGDNTYSKGYKYDNNRKLNLDGSAYVENTFANALDTTYYKTTPIFKTSWIKQNDLVQYYCYYFEIPINAGEYCLSSVANTNGAYLMYLDIGANAAKMNRTAIAEYITEVTTSWNFPKGMALVATGTSPTNINAMNSYCIVVDSSYSGTVTLSRTSNTAATAVYTDTTNRIKLGFYNDDLTVTGNPNALQMATPISTNTDNIKRITYYDYGTGDGSLHKVIVTKVNSADPTVERFTYSSSTDTWTTATATAVPLYDSEGRTVTTTSATNALFTETTMAARFSALAAESPIIGMSVMYLSTGTVTISYALQGSLQETGTGRFYVVSGYAISINYSGDANTTAEVNVLSYVSTYNTISITFKINGTAVSAQTLEFSIPIA